MKVFNCIIFCASLFLWQIRGQTTGAKDLFTLRYINNKTIGINPLFICCGKKNQLIKTAIKARAVNLKYFCAQLFLEFIKNAMIVCVGQAHSRLKLSLVIL